LRGDLHDGLGPSLSGVGLGLQALADSVGEGGSTASGALLDRIRDEVAVAVSEVRRIIDGLRPTALDTLGLPDAIRRHAETVSAAVPVRVDAGDLDTSTALLDRIRDEVDIAVTEVRRIIDGLRPTALDTLRLPDAIRRHAQTVSAKVPVTVEAADLPALPPPVENAAYRITTEALTNAARHADARAVRVTLAAPDGALEITVSDDGCGVGTAVAGVGLASMRRRAETLGGQLGVASAADGTTVTAILPLERP
jgi:signal transduction histidine kinase